MTLQRWLTSLLILPALLILSTHPSQATPFQLALGCHTVRVPQSTSYTYTHLLVSLSRMPYTYLIGTYSSVPATCRLRQAIVLKHVLSHVNVHIVPTNFAFPFASSVAVLKLTEPVECSSQAASRYHGIP